MRDAHVVLVIVLTKPNLNKCVLDTPNDTDINVLCDSGKTVRDLKHWAHDNSRIVRHKGACRHKPEGHSKDSCLTLMARGDNDRIIMQKLQMMGLTKAIDPVSGKIATLKGSSIRRRSFIWGD